MYSPRIYENQIPCLYHAARFMEVPMTQLANAFIYYGLISGYYGSVASELLPQPNRVVPEGVKPRMQIFNPRYDSINDYMRELPTVDTLNLYFQTLKNMEDGRTPHNNPILRHRGKEDEPVPF